MFIPNCCQQSNLPGGLLYKIQKYSLYVRGRTTVQVAVLDTPKANVGTIGEGGGRCLYTLKVHTASRVLHQCNIALKEGKKVADRQPDCKISLTAGNTHSCVLLPHSHVCITASVTGIRDSASGKFKTGCLLCDHYRAKSFNSNLKITQTHPSTFGPS